MPFDFGDFELLSFDCFGTLIDWESGIASALLPWLAAHEIKLERDAVLALYAKHEAAIESEPYRSYREVLREVGRRLAKELGFKPSQVEIDLLPNSLAAWPPFPDTREALQQLKQRFRLAVISNVDNDLFAGTQNTLDVKFDHLVTAQLVGAYKPDVRVFQAAESRFAIEKRRWLHVAQRLYHDILPAGEFGLQTAWVNRRHALAGEGATPSMPGDVKPDMVVRSLAELVELIESSGGQSD